MINKVTVEPIPKIESERFDPKWFCWRSRKKADAEKSKNEMIVQMDEQDAQIKTKRINKWGPIIDPCGTPFKKSKTRTKGKWIF